MLYNKVKNAEYARQKQEQTVRKLHGKLLERKRQNDEKLKKEMIEATKEQRELEYKLEREKANLSKVSSLGDKMESWMGSWRLTNPPIGLMCLTSVCLSIFLFGDSNSNTLLPIDLKLHRVVWHHLS